MGKNKQTKNKNVRKNYKKNLGKIEKQIEKNLVNRLDFFELVDLADHLIKQIENKN